MILVLHNAHIVQVLEEREVLLLHLYRVLLLRDPIQEPSLEILKNVFLLLSRLLLRRIQRLFRFGIFEGLGTGIFDLWHRLGKEKIVWVLDWGLLSFYFFTRLCGLDRVRFNFLFWSVFFLAACSVVVISLADATFVGIFEFEYTEILKDVLGLIWVTMRAICGAIVLVMRICDIGISVKGSARIGVLLPVFFHGREIISVDLKSFAKLVKPVFRGLEAVREVGQDQSLLFDDGLDFLESLELRKVAFLCIHELVELMLHLNILDFPASLLQTLGHILFLQPSSDILLLHIELFRRLAHSHDLSLRYQKVNQNYSYQLLSLRKK